MNKYFLWFFFISNFTLCQVGIQTAKVSPSAILEINTGDLTTGNKKGFLGPRVILAGNNDTTTIPNPAVGLLVYNTADSGSFPTNVLANRFYFWNGTKWADLGLTSVLQNYVADKVLSLNSTSTQTFAYSGSNSINNTSGTNGGIVVTFADSDIILNTGSFAAKSGNAFIIKTTGLYEISGFVNYNPNRTMIATGQRGCFLNIKLQRSTNNGSSWSDVIGNRTAWGTQVTNSLKTTNLISTPIYLNTGDRLRMVVQNPLYPEGSDTAHGDNNTTSPLPVITVSNQVPISKSLTILLLDYDLQ